MLHQPTTIPSTHTRVKALDSGVFSFRFAFRVANQTNPSSLRDLSWYWSWWQQMAARSLWTSFLHKGLQTRCISPESNSANPAQHKHSNQHNSNRKRSTNTKPMIKLKTMTGKSTYFKQLLKIQPQKQQFHVNSFYAFSIIHPFWDSDHCGDIQKSIHLR